jgi:hypothetical protein
VDEENHEVMFITYSPSRLQARRAEAETKLSIEILYKSAALLQSLRK